LRCIGMNVVLAFCSFSVWLFLLAEGACLSDAVPENERKNVIIDGVDMPLGMWFFTWGSAELVQHMIKIIAEEVPT